MAHNFSMTSFTHNACADFWNYLDVSVGDGEPLYGPSRNLLNIDGKYRKTITWLNGGG